MLSVICLTLILLLFANAGSIPLGNDTNIGKRIINGKMAPQNLYPFVVSIRGDDPSTAVSSYCGGTLIHKQWVLTAAHCFTATTSNGETMRNPKFWHIQAGSVNIDLNWGDGKYSSSLNPIMALINLLAGASSSNTVQMKNIEHVHAEKIILHPKYTDSDLEYDIALIKLAKPLKRKKNVDTIFLPPNNDYQSWPTKNSMCRLVGWGCTKAKGSAVNKARMADFKVVSNTWCSEVYNHEAGLNDDHEFCAGYRNKGIGICPGDSGSGLFCITDGKFVLEGIASATHRNKPSQYPGVFTRVSFFRNWIEQTVSSN